MDTDGACGLLFCAAKRSGAFPPNMPAGLRARVSRLGGFTRPFSQYKRNYITRNFSRLQFYKFELGIHKHAQKAFMVFFPETSKTADMNKK
jgi:hypothetical protein